MRFSITELLLIALIVILLFGTRKLRGVGSDLGNALRDFKKAMHDEPQKPQTPTPPDQSASEHKDPSAPQDK